jgi:hypothetical protein
MNCKSKLRGAIVLSIIFFLTSILPAYSQLRWDGGGGDGQWTTAANWAGDILPSSTDAVLLDNTLVTGNYAVVMPGGMETVTLQSLVIQPVVGNSIELILPSANNATPALIISGPGYGLTIHNGGIFRNASGISSGQSMQVADSLRINNGGRYIHQTRGSHAASISQILSRVPGTETGMVEFDVPGSTGYTISASARVYGTLILSANAAGLARTYSSSGASNFWVRGNFQLNAGVNYNINLAGNIIVDGNLMHDGNSLNISSGGDNTILQLKGNLSQSGIITETSTGLPVMELCGTTQQQISVTGSIENSISLRLNNSAGAILQSPLTLPYKLELVNGKITSTSTNLVTLLPACTIEADSLSNNSFVNGPLRKDGLSADPHFLFPVGKDLSTRWLALKNATGNFTVEYFKADPRQLNDSCGNGIDHISALEYWSIEAAASSASPELSFTDPNSGGVTDLSTLRVAQLDNNIWGDAGNISVTGTPGANGSVTGNMLRSFGPTAKYFTLAGSDGVTNPLPVILSHFSVRTNGRFNLLSWNFEGEAEYFLVMHSVNGRDFFVIDKVYTIDGKGSYQFKHMKAGISYYQLRIMRKHQSIFKSPVLSVTNGRHNDWLMSVAAGDQLTMTISASGQKTEMGFIMDASGRMVKQFSVWLNPGINNVTTSIGNLPAGTYTVRLLTNSLQFVKW